MIQFSKSQLFLITVLLAWFAPVVASAHITMEPNKAVASEYAKLTFRVPHGCDGSATNKITILIPEGALSVKPQVHSGWKISMKKSKLAKPMNVHGQEVTEAISEVSWSGGPLEDEYMDEFSLSLKLPEKSNSHLAFPVIQDCEKGSVRWAGVGAEDHSHHGGDSPAPYLVLESAGPGQSKHH